MSYERVESLEGEFAIDWDIVRRIICSYWVSQKQNEHAKEVSVSERTLNPFSWMLPEVTNVEVDWPAVRREAEANTDSELMAMKWNVNRSVKEIARDLQRKVQQTRRAKQSFRDRMSRLQTSNSQAIDAAVSNYDTAIGGAKLVRDTSFETVMIMAGTLSGGTALAVIGAGSALKGTAKWQDTGNVGAALIEVSGSFIFGVIPVARAGAGAVAGRTEKLVLVTLEASFESIGAVVEGDTLGKALAKGSVKMLAPGVGNLVKSDAVQKMLGRAVVPARIEVLSSYVESYAKFGFGKGAGIAIDKAFAKNQAGGTSGGAVACNACDASSALLRLAIVDMKKGASLMDFFSAAAGR